jgi:hypothetical protein
MPPSNDIYVKVATQQVASVTAVGIQGLSGSAGGTLDAISNVDASAKTEGSVLVYKTGTSLWTATTTLDQQNVEGGHY